MPKTHEEVMALEAGEELDALIAFSHMGWKRVPIGGNQEVIHFPGGALAFPVGTPLHGFGVPSYSTNPEDTNRIMQTLDRRGFTTRVTISAGQPVRCQITDRATETEVADVEADSYALAVCRAALMVP